jgi:hypothetical protein
MIMASPSIFTSCLCQELIAQFFKRQSSVTIPRGSQPRDRDRFVYMHEQPAWLGGGELRLRDYQMAGLNWLASGTRNEKKKNLKN